MKALECGLPSGFANLSLNVEGRETIAEKNLKLLAAQGTPSGLARATPSPPCALLRAGDTEAASDSAAGFTAAAKPATGPTALPSRAGKSRSIGALPQTRLDSAAEGSDSVDMRMWLPDLQDAEMAPPASAPVSAPLSSCVESFRNFETRKAPAQRALLISVGRRSHRR